MAKSYQLVAWTDKGQVKMIPSLLNDYIREEIEHINQLGERVRYGTNYEVQDLLRVSSAFERLGINLLKRGYYQQAFLCMAEAAFCCTSSRNNWTDTEWGEMLCKPLQGRFFAMFWACKDLLRQHPTLQRLWEHSELQKTMGYVTYPYDVYQNLWDELAGNFWEEWKYNRALNYFGKNEVYRRRRA